MTRMNELPFQQKTLTRLLVCLVIALAIAAGYYYNSYDTLKKRNARLQKEVLRYQAELQRAERVGSSTEDDQGGLNDQNELKNQSNPDGQNKLEGQSEPRTQDKQMQ